MNPWSKEERDVGALDAGDWINPFWKSNLMAISTAFADELPDDFLDDPAFHGFQTNIPELAQAEHDDPRLRQLVDDVFSDETLTPTTVHHLYGLAQWLYVADSPDVAELTVMEWGGGWGNLARLWHRLAPNSTYVIVDLPFMSLIQWRYLCDALGADAVALNPDVVQPGRVNLVPVGFASELDDVDVFISTWALSESPRKAHELIARRRWFGAQHLLLGFDETAVDLFTDLPSFLDLIEHEDGHRQPLPVGIGSYFFR